MLKALLFQIHWECQTEWKGISSCKMSYQLLQGLAFILNHTLLYCSCKELSAPSEPDPIAFALHCQKVPDGSV